MPLGLVIGAWSVCAPALAAGGSAELSATSPSYADALSLVDQLAWAASDREVARYVEAAARPDSVYARSLREADRQRGPHLDEPTLYAVEATVVRAAEPRHPAGRIVGMSVREAVVYRNHSGAPLELLVMRVFANGQEVHRDLTAIRGVWVDNQPVEWLLDETVLVVALPEPLGPRDSARVLVDLHQRVPWFEPGDRARSGADGGFATEETGAYGWSGEHVNLGFWLPLVTPVAGAGRFDVRPLRENTEHAWFEPALFHVVLDVPTELSVSATGIELERREGAGRTTVVGVASGAREYAVMLAEARSERSVEVAGTRLRVSYPSERPELGAQLLSRAEGALRTLTDVYGPLSMAELDVVEAPSNIALGIEFPGLVTVDLVHSTPGTSLTDGQEWTVAHEVAHQWWSAEVGNDPGAEPWLDEALANHGAALYWERKYGRDAVEEVWDDEVVGPTRRLRELGVPDLPADWPAWRYDLRQYSTVVYGRATLFFDRVRAELGDEAFAAAMRAYYREHRGRHVTAEDLLDALRAHAPDPARIDALHQRWIAEGHGYEDLLE